jgi:hypothetical protein
MEARSWLLLIFPLVLAPVEGLYPSDLNDPEAVTSGLAGRLDESISIRRAAYQRVRNTAGFSVQWLGQDGQDYVSPNNRLEPSEVQDIHLLLSGLDPRHEVAFVDVTAQGGDQWHYNAQSFAWKAELKRQKGSARADLFIEPGRAETGRAFHVLVRYDDGTTVEASIRSRRTDPLLRMPGAALQAKWIGQDRQDWTGSGPSVGPDGLQDVRIHLSRLGVKVPIKSIRIDGPAGPRWEFGTNLQLLATAELVRDSKDPSQGDLYLQPDRDLASQRLKLTILYENEKKDGATITAGRCDPALRMPQSSLPRIEERPIAAQWLGQDGVGRGRPGDVHVVLSGLPAIGRIGAVILSDSVRGNWVHRSTERVSVPADPPPEPLDVTFRPDRTTADLFFPPYRDSRGDTFTVRFVAMDGRMSFARFSGGPSDVGLRAEKPEATRVEAKPGDDLQALVDRYGMVVLSKGTYRLAHTLVLNRPVTITSEGGTTLTFAQHAADAPWTAAIKVHCGNTTLSGFAVRFEGPVRWNNDVSYGPAVIGMTDNLDSGHDGLKVNVVFTRLDLEVTVVENRGGWSESLRLFRLIRAQSGAVTANRLRGGPIEFFDGPWHVVDNEFRGTPPGTFSHGFVTGHNTHDLVIRNNRLSSPEPSGKTWRFLVLTGYSALDRIEGNVVEGIGARDDDTIPWNNEPEIILTEGYFLKYEGKVMALSKDARVLRIGRAQGPAIRAGDIIALLNGPAAGQWRRVAQVIDPATLLVDAAIPAGTETVSVTTGFVSEVFEGNRIDLRGGRRSDSFVLAGNHFGTRVANNHLLGGGLAFRMMAYPTENPMMWGWSHAPVLGAVIEGNILEDCEQGGIVGVEHSPAIKTNKGRTYMSVALRQNVVRWTAPFLARMARSDAKEPLAGLTIGYRPSHDPGELVVSSESNALDAPRGYDDAPALLIHAAQYNAQRVVNRRSKLAAAGSGAQPGRRASTAGGSPTKR